MCGCALSVMLTLAVVLPTPHTLTTVVPFKDNTLIAIAHQYPAPKLVRYGQYSVRLEGSQVNKKGLATFKTA